MRKFRLEEFFAAEKPSPAPEPAKKIATLVSLPVTAIPSRAPRMNVSDQPEPQAAPSPFVPSLPSSGEVADCDGGFRTFFAAAAAGRGSAYHEEMKEGSGRPAGRLRKDQES